MRVHPSLLSTRAAKWQYIAAFGLLIFLLLMTAFRRPQQVVVAPRVDPATLRPVVITQRALGAGEPFDLTQLKIEQRAINTLPSDVVSTFNELKDKVAAGPVPAGYPVSRAFLAEPMPLLPPSESELALTEPGKEDPLELILSTIEATTVGVTLDFDRRPPPRGSRVALALIAPSGRMAIVVDDAWVTDSHGGQSTLRVEPTKAVFLQSLKQYGSLTYFDIPSQGPSPYSGQAMPDVKALELALGIVKGKTAPVVAQQEGRRFKGYAWVPGSGKRYGVDAEGNMFLVDRNGKEIPTNSMMGAE